MTKPTGAICNLDCDYCYFLSKEMLYPGSRFRMADELLEEYVRQFIEAQRVAEVTFAWQGGEPTLMGLPFFERALELQRKHRRPGMRIVNTLQTNGTKLDDEWGEFFRRNEFLVGLSIDGPGHLHDRYRVDKGGKGSFERVMRGLAVLKKHRVEFNVLTTVHAGNQDHPLEVYRFLRDEVGTKFMQFIPIVERDNDSGFQEGEELTSRTVDPSAYGRFLTTIYDEWVRRDVGRVFVQLFDVTLGKYVGEPGGLCVFDETCGSALALEHNGDVYSCDHFVEPAHLLGNLTELPLAQMVGSEQQQRFGQAKRDSLPRQCRECEVRWLCHGGCPKDRLATTGDGEAGLNYLCEGLFDFFTHSGPTMRFMAGELRAARPPANVMAHLAADRSGGGGSSGERSGVRGGNSSERSGNGTSGARGRSKGSTKVGRNQPCPCGSGRKYKHCCAKA